MKRLTECFEANRIRTLSKQEEIVRTIKISMGIEPTTLSTQNLRSIQMSYDEILTLLLAKISNYTLN